MDGHAFPLLMRIYLSVFYYHGDHLRVAVVPGVKQIDSLITGELGEIKLNIIIING